MKVGGNDVRANSLFSVLRPVVAWQNPSRDESLIKPKKPSMLQQQSGRDKHKKV